VLRDTPRAFCNLLVASSDDDLDGNSALDEQTKGRLKAGRKSLRHLVKDEHVERLRQVKLIDEILGCTERVLNPAAHSGTPPLYEKEVEDALALIKQLESALTP
jgi:hypothetical protein